MSEPPGLSPICARCRHRHRTTLPCWNGWRVGHTRALVLATYGTDCHLCGGPGATTVDHLLPRSRGGTDQLPNLRPAHTWCNIAAGNKPAVIRPEVSDRW